MKDGRFGTNAANVCLKRLQFSSWNGDPVNNRNLLRVINMPRSDPTLLDCALAYDEAAAGADPTGGATHYFDTSISPPSWTKVQPDGRQAIKTCQIGKLIFFKDVP